jgi:signal transduction histidine kinase
MKSLRHYLQRRWLISLVLIMLPLLWLTDFGVRQLISHSVLSRLQHDSEGLIAALTVTPSGDWQLNQERLSGVFQRVYSGHYFAIIDQHNRIQRSRSLWDRPMPAIGDVSDTPIHWRQRYRGGEQQDELWLNLAVSSRINNHNFTIWVAEDLTPLRQLLNRYRLLALAVISAALVLLMIIQRLQLRHAFAQLHPLQQALQQLRKGERQQLNENREARYPAEVQPLADEVDRLLQQLQQRVSRSRNALGNLAHEMKRPVQQLQRLSEQLDPQQQQHLKQTLLQLQQLTERELKRARIVGTSSPGRQLRLKHDLPPLLQVLQQLHPNSHIDARYDDNDSLPHDRDDLLELLGNLLDNACKYAPGPITLSIRQSDSQPLLNSQPWLIDVCDQGPGIRDDLKQQLLQRGTRLDESATDGSGLGLAIVADIVASYQGQLLLENNGERGLCVRVKLPAPQ